MKNVKPWQTRYEELAIPISCEQCGAQFVAEGKTDDFKVIPITNPRVKKDTAITVACPCCKSILFIDPTNYPTEVKTVLQFLQKA